MAGLDPAIHVLPAKEAVDARRKAGHDGGDWDCYCVPLPSFGSSLVIVCFPFTTSAI